MVTDSHIGNVRQWKLDQGVSADGCKYGLHAQNKIFDEL